MVTEGGLVFTSSTYYLQYEDLVFERVAGIRAMACRHGGDWDMRSKYLVDRFVM